MRRLGVIGLLVSAVLAPAAVFALTQSSIPPKFGLAWGTNAGAPYIRSIPQSSQIGIQNCAASLNDGFPPLTFTPPTAGGCPPFGQDFNGILKQLSQWAQWQSAGGPVFWDSAFSTSIGGYPSGAIISSAVTPGTQFMSTVDNNTTNPDASTANQVVGGTGWVQAPGQVPIGSPRASFSNTADPGSVIADSTTIGDASSNAGRANADTQFLFAFLWVNCTNTVCPILTSGGSPTTRGATAAADYAAHKQLSTPEMQGAGLIAVDSGGTTFLSGVPVTSGSGTVTASILGENTHTLTRSEIPTGITSNNASQTISVSVGLAPGGAGVVEVTSGFSTQFVSSGSGLLVPTANNFSVLSTASGSGSNSISVTSNNTGGGAHNNAERSFTVKWNLKL